MTPSPGDGSGDPQGQQEFKFMLVGAPEQTTKNPQYRRQIRSHVTSLQHRRSRQTSSFQQTPDPVPAEEGEKALKGKGAKRQPKPEVHRQESRGEPQELPATESSSDAPRRLQDVKGRTTSARGQGRVAASARVKIRPKLRKPASPKPVFAPRSPQLEFPPSFGEQAFKTFVMDDVANVVDPILKGLGMTIFGALSHYESIVMFQAQDFEFHYPPETKQDMAYHALIPTIFKEPALLSVTLMISAGQHLARNPGAVSASDAYRMLQLQGLAIKNINAALSDPDRALCDEMISAVLLFATFDVLHGLTDSYHHHMMGLVHMINLRGGLKDLGPRGILEKFFVWEDCTISSIFGCRGYRHLPQNPSSYPQAKSDKSLMMLHSPRLQMPV